MLRVRRKQLTVEGLGPAAYLAGLDGQHNLHCLDALRRYAYRSYYFPETGKGNFTAIREAHLSHCLHLLLQTLSCNYNFDLITYNVRSPRLYGILQCLLDFVADDTKWMETQKNPFPDFAVNKKCVDHNRILDWQTKNRVLPELLEELPVHGPPEGQEILPVSPKLGEWATREDDQDRGH
jgi:hypothetical protein